ncbi:MAG: hypothetical protein GY696_38725, partial [Gammaproteobacteria bacterium]|nr:hypothetical protein [Gammaproteobacteria bacterium]
AEEPFLAGRPDHWISPTPGIDDAVHEEQGISEEVEPNVDHGGIGPSIYDGRDIPRPRMNSRRDISPDKPVEMREESAEEVEHPEPTKKSTQDPNRGVIQDQLSTMFEDSDEEYNLTQCMLADSGITVEDAMKSADADSWKAAIEKEDRGLEKKGVLSTQECPAKAKPLKTKYILTKKKAPDGSIIKFKARRVVQGFHQKYGRDFIET